MIFIFNKNIIFANNHPYLPLEELDLDQKGFFTHSDLHNAAKEFSEEGISDFFKEFGKDEVDEISWLNYIQNDKPYGHSKKSQYFDNSQNFLRLKYKERKKIKDKETDRIYTDDKILILQPKTYKSMVLYGYDTKWCYSSSSTDEHYNDEKNESLFYIIFNKSHKSDYLHFRSKHEYYPFYKFLLKVNKKSKIWFFDDQTNRLLTSKCTYDQNMNKTDENSIRHVNFLLSDDKAIKALCRSIDNQI